MKMKPAWRRVIVTGASGFLGNCLVKHLRILGIEVIALSRSTGYDILRDELPLEGVDRVIHLAGMAGVPSSWTQPSATFEANALGTVRVLDQCRRSKCGVTHMSAYVYGVPEYLPITELHSLGAPNPYAFSKVIAEEACAFFEDKYELDCVRLRLFNAYGPNQHSSFLIPTIVAQVIDPSCQAVTVQDLAPARDYIHVDDVAAAILSTSIASPGSILNIGSGQSKTVGEVVQIAMSVAGVTKLIEVSGVVRPNEIPSVVADIKRIEAVTGWFPKLSFEEGMRTVIDAMREQERK